MAEPNRTVAYQARAPLRSQLHWLPWVLPCLSPPTWSGELLELRWLIECAS